MNIILKHMIWKCWIWNQKKIQIYVALQSQNNYNCRVGNTLNTTDMEPCKIGAHHQSQLKCHIVLLLGSPILSECTALKAIGVSCQDARRVKTVHELHADSDIAVEGMFYQVSNRQSKYNNKNDICRIAWHINKWMLANLVFRCKYSRKTWPIKCWLMPWLNLSPGHQQQ